MLSTSIKSICWIFLFVTLTTTHLLANEQEKKNQSEFLVSKYQDYRLSNLDSAKHYNQKILDLYKSDIHDSMYIQARINAHSYKYYRHKNYSFIERDLKEIQSLLTEIGNKEVLYNQWLKCYGDMYYHQGNFTRSFYYYSSSLKYFEKNLSEVSYYNSADIYYTLHRIYKEVFNDKENADFYRDQLKYKYEETGYLWFGALYYQIKSYEYSDANDFVNARKAIIKSQKIAYESGALQFILETYTNLLNYYIKCAEYDSALMKMPEIYKLTNSVNETNHAYARFVTIHGHIYDQIGDYANSLKYNKEALRIRRALKDSSAVLSSLINISNDLINLECYNEAELLLDTVFIQIKDLKHYHLYDRYYRIHINVLTKNGHFEEAMNQSMAYVVFKDSLLKYQADQKIDLYRYQSLMDKKTMQMVEKELEYKDQVYLYQMILIFFLILILMLFIRIIYVKRKENKMIKEQQLALKKAKEIAENADRLKSNFLANMSHEIRTPLNAILGFSNILVEHPELEAERQFKFREIITSNSEYLLDLINNILDLSRLEAEGVNLKLRPYSTLQLLEELKNVSEANIKSDSLKIAISNEVSSFPDSIDIDKNKLKQVFLIFISNAIKFTPKGNIVFGIEKVDAQRIYFYVKDTGIGIKESNLEVIFNRFIQKGESQIEEIKHHKGSGLGLAIAKTLIKAMGGEIHVDSIFGEGSTFSFSVLYKADS